MTKYFTVENAYERNKDLKKEDVLVLQEWMGKQPHLPKITEMKLIIFLHACYYKIETTKMCIDNYFTFKARWPEFALQRNVFSDDMQQAFQFILATVLPLNTKDNHVVMYGRLFDSDPLTFDYMNFVKAFDMIISAWTRLKGTCEGHVLIMDTEGATFSHIFKVNITALKEYMYYTQDAMPVRLKAVHVINIAPVFHTLLKLAKPFIRSDLMEICEKMAPSVNVEEEYKKNAELRKEDVELLQEWTSKQTHLPKISDIELVLFLHSCYYKIEETKLCIDNFYTIRTVCPEFFSNRDPKSNPAETLNLLLYVPLTKLTPDGHKVIFAKLIDPNPDNYTFAGQVKAFDMATMLMLHQEGTHDGIVVVTDMKEVTFSHFTKLGVVQIKKFFYYLQNAMPVRIKGLHFLNIPTFMDKIVSLMKPFMKSELFQVLYLHSDNFDKLYKFVPQECLPKEYGGEMPDVQELIKIQNKNILDNAEYFVEEEKQIVDESKRSGQPRSDSDIFGMEGTFKRLTID